MSQATDARKLRDQLRSENFQVEMTGGGHWEVRWAGERVSTFPQTPSDRRWKQNALGDIKRWKRAKGIATRRH